MKNKLINSVSLLTICIMLNGCADTPNVKSKEEIIAEVAKGNKASAAIASQLVATARNEGIPLPPKIMEVLQDDIQDGSEEPPADSSATIREIGKETDELVVLGNTTTNLEELPELILAKINRLQYLRNLFVRQLEEELRRGGAPTDPAALHRTLQAALIERLSSVPPTPGSVATRVPDASIGNSGSNSGVLVMPLGEGSKVAFRVNTGGFSRAATNVISQWLQSGDPLVNTDPSSGAVVVAGSSLLPRITTDEMVRLVTEAALHYAGFYGAVLGPDESSELVNSFTNIGAIQAAVSSSTFRTLPAPQQQLVLQAVVAIAHSSGPAESGVLSLQDRVNALTLVAALENSSTSSMDSMRNFLVSRGVTNPLLLQDTLRVVRVLQETQTMSARDRMRVLGGVLMIANHSATPVSDADFDGLITAVRANPRALLADSSTLALPPSIDRGVLPLVLSRMRSVDALPWNATSSSSSFMRALTQQTEALMLPAGGQLDESRSLVATLAQRRVPSSSVVSVGGSDVTDETSGTAVALLPMNQTLNLLPTTTALDILVQAQRVAVDAASAAHAAAIPILRLTYPRSDSEGSDGGESAPIPIDPKVELANFVEKYKSITKGDEQGINTVYLQKLREDIKKIQYTTGHFREFDLIPDIQKLGNICLLSDDPKGYARLLYSANSNDINIMPRLVDHIINGPKGLAENIGYYPNGASGRGVSRDSIQEIKYDGNNETLYNKIIADLGGLIDIYLSNIREAIFRLIRSSDRIVEISELSAGMVPDLTSLMTTRDARTRSGGQLDLRGVSVSGVSGNQVALGLPLFVQMKGSVDSGKSTEAALGSVAYRLGNTVIGALQAYANRGVGFGLEGQQFESSVVVSHSFGAVFLEGQMGSVSASDVHFSDWSGFRSQVTLGLDTAYVSPFVQVTYRQLDRDGHHQLNDTTASVGLDMDIASLSGDTYRIDSRLLTKVGYGEKAWSQGSRDLGRVTGFQGSVEWSASLNLNSGITFSTSLGLDTVLGSNAGINVRLEQ